MRNLENENTYARPDHKFRIGVARHNVADLIELDEEKAAGIKGKYSQRFGHIPQGGEIEGILVDEPSSSNPVVESLLTAGYQNTQAQARYLGELSGDSNRFTLFTPRTLLDDLDSNGGHVLMAPYLNNGKLNQYLEEQGLIRPDIEISGLDSAIVHDLKDKGKFHNLVKEAQNPDFAVPHHEVVKVEEVAARSRELVAFEDELYEAIDMPNYRKGIFGRLSFSDGGFGSFNVHANEEGKVVLETDDRKKHPIYDTWEEALADAQDFMSKSTGGNEDADVVISRSLNLHDVPGLSMFFMEGDVLPLGFNGQILDEKTKACVGTTTYEPTDPYIKQRKPDFENRVTAASKQFVHDFAREKGLDPQELRGAMNVDVMILGAQEQEAQRRIIEGLQNGTFDTSLRGKLKKYGQLDQPSDFFLAESNPRRTNLIEAIDEVLLVDRLDQNVANMRSVLKKGLRAEDYYPVPQGVDINALTDELLATYQPDVREDGMVILRTRPIEAPKKGKLAQIGVIMTGEPEKRQQELQTIFDGLKKGA